MNNLYLMTKLLEKLSENQKKEFYDFLIYLDCHEKQGTLNIQELSSAFPHQDD